MLPNRFPTSAHGADGDGMRVALVAESFLPRVNGVSNSVIRIARYLQRNGHQTMIVAPDSYTAELFEDVPVSRVTSLAVPGIHETEVAFGSTEKLTRAIREFMGSVARATVESRTWDAVCAELIAHHESVLSAENELAG